MAATVCIAQYLAYLHNIWLTCAMFGLLALSDAWNLPIHRCDGDPDFLAHVEGIQAIEECALAQQVRNAFGPSYTHTHTPWK